MADQPTPNDKPPKLSEQERRFWYIYIAVAATLLKKPRAAAEALRMLSIDPLPGEDGPPGEGMDR